MTEQEKPRQKGRIPAPGDKRQFLVSMDAAVIRAIKTAAIDGETTASLIMEEAATQWLARRKAKKDSGK
jgi:hypothetical protein